MNCTCISFTKLTEFQFLKHIFSSEDLEQEGIETYHGLPRKILKWKSLWEIAAIIKQSMSE